MALVPKGVDREHGLITTVEVAVVRPQPQNGAEKGWITKGVTSVYTKDLKFGERRGFSGTAFRAGDKKRAWAVFSLTVRNCKRDKKQRIEDYFSKDLSSEDQEDLKRLKTREPRAEEPGQERAAPSQPGTEHPNSTVRVYPSRWASAWLEYLQNFSEGAFPWAPF